MIFVFRSSPSRQCVLMHVVQLPPGGFNVAIVVIQGPSLTVLTCRSLSLSLDNGFSSLCIIHFA